MRPHGLRLIGALLVGLTLTVLGLAILTTWEIEAFRATTLDRDFTGLTCGSPFNNPGWDTGTPCHGAVNRQTAFGLVVLGLGVISNTGTLAYIIREKLWRNPRQTGNV